MIFAKAQEQEDLKLTNEEKEEEENQVTKPHGKTQTNSQYSLSSIQKEFITFLNNGNNRSFNCTLEITGEDNLGIVHLITAVQGDLVLLIWEDDTKAPSKLSLLHMWFIQLDRNFYMFQSNNG